MSGTREHRILAEHPAIRDHRAKIAKHDEATDAHRRRGRADWQKYEAEVAAWREARNTALVSGEEIPPEPTEPRSSAEDSLILTRERQEMMRAEREVIAQIADELLAEADRLEPELLARASGLVEELSRIAGELDGLASVADRIGRIRGLVAESRNIRVEDVVAAVKDGRRRRVVRQDAVQVEHRIHRMAVAHRGEV